MSKVCFICKTKIDDQYFRTNQTTNCKSHNCINCPNCTHYNICDAAVFKFEDEQKRLDEMREVISKYLREHPGTCIDVEFAEGLLNLKE